MILLTVIAVLIFYGSIFCKEIEINLDTITVTGEKSDNSKIKVEREEQKFGLQEDLNEILFLKSV